jgi:predicted Zn-dependent protease
VLLDIAGHPAEALWWAHRAADYHPEIPSYQSTLAQILVELGREGEAEWPLRLAVASSDHKPVDDLHLAELLASLHRDAEARAALAPVRRDPKLADAARRLDARLTAPGR